MPHTAASLRVLLEGVIDYAGLFPPARLDMASAVRNYAEYRASDMAWMLGRFIAPVSRLDEFEEHAGGFLPHDPGMGWRLSALPGTDLCGDLAAVSAFNNRHGAADAGAAVVDAIEIKATTPAEIEAAMRAVPKQLDTYIEIPVTHDPTPLIATIGRFGARAKVRTGGVTPDAFPLTTDLIRFLAACVRAEVPFKATAGLHHPIRAVYRLTYEPDCESGTMFGFLNVLLAAALLRAGFGEALATELLEETSAAAFRFDAAGVRWREHRIGTDVLAATRRSSALSFGSCSFAEPIDDLTALHLL